MLIISRHARRSTRPATIRPVPATFGAGILVDVVETTRAAVFDAETAAVAAGLDAQLAENAARAASNRKRLAAREAELATLDAPPAPTGRRARMSFSDQHAEECALNGDPRDRDLEIAEAEWLYERSRRTCARTGRFIPAAEDNAWDLGYRLGRDGIDAAPYHATHAETMAFLAGHERGMVAYHDDQRAEVEALIAAWEADHGHDAELAELAEAGSCVGHYA